MSEADKIPPESAELPESTEPPERSDGRGLGARILDAALSGYEDPRALGVLRIAVVTISVLTMITHLGNVTEFFSARSVIGGEWAAHAFPSRYSYFFEHGDPSTVLFVFWLGLLSGVAWAAGFATRLSAVIHTFVWMSMYGRNPLLYAYPDQLTLMLLYLLALMPSGRGLSVDAWLLAKFRERRGQDHAKRLVAVPVWCRRVIQLQLAVLYTSTGLLKTGDTWREEGTAIYYTLTNPYNRHFDLSALLAGVQPWLLRPLTYAVLVWEVAFAGFVVVYWIRDALGRTGRKLPDLRWLFLGFGLAMHAGIQLALYIVWFTALMFASYLAFFSWEEMTAIARRVVSLPTRLRQRLRRGKPEATEAS